MILKRLTCAAALLALGLMAAPAGAEDMAPAYDVVAGPYHIHVYFLVYDEMTWLYALKSKETGVFSANSDTFANALGEYSKMVTALALEQNATTDPVLEAMKNPTTIHGYIATVKNDGAKDIHDMVYTVTLEGIGTAFTVPDWLLPLINDSPEADNHGDPPSEGRQVWMSFVPGAKPLTVSFSYNDPDS